jgi:hypothetical protein
VANLQGDGGFPAGRVDRGRDLTRGVGGRQARTGGLIATGEGAERITLFVGGGLFLATLWHEFGASKTLPIGLV